ncbi:hypothetical protein BaRGS_00016440 [Batillaria attramentaria]|uniref:Sulfotransferase domain-containing protein n=1 Tax=Batillaria attramentaria TaxID=370345 RepID=A0ABD0KYT8_9CAEN
MNFACTVTTAEPAVSSLALRCTAPVNLPSKLRFAGQNWTNQMVKMLLEGTTDLPVLSGESKFIWIDVAGWENQLPPPVKPRALWSHLRFRNLPRGVEKKKVKVVFITRNLKDVFVSQYNFLKNFYAPIGYQGTWPQFFEYVFENGR